MVAHHEELKWRRDEEQDHVDDGQCETGSVQAADVRVMSCARSTFV